MPIFTLDEKEYFIIEWLGGKENHKVKASSENPPVSVLKRKYHQYLLASRLYVDHQKLCE